MLYSVKDIEGFALNASDGTIGSVEGVLFDDERWAIRHVVVATGGWLSGRKVLISPHAVTRIDRADECLDVALTRSRVKDAPAIGTEAPPSREQEAAYYDYYGYPYYWSGPALWGASARPTAYPMTGGTALAVPPPDVVGHEAAERMRAEREAGRPRLHGSQSAMGCAVEATDGSIGSIDDLLFDSDSWEVRYLDVDTGDWLPGPSILVATRAVDDVDWNARIVRLRVTRATVQATPPLLRDGNTLSAEYEERLQRHYHEAARR
jgi:uncharacterized protein YrrD